MTLSVHSFTSSRPSIYGLLTSLFDGKSNNLLRFDYKGCALAPMAAFKRLTSKETLDSVAKGHIQHGQPMAFVQVGTRKDNLNIMMTRNMNTRKADGSYDTRSYIISSPLMGLNVPSIEIQRSFQKGWELIELTDLATFPLPLKEEQQELGELLMLRAKLEAEKDFIGKNKDALNRAFSKMREKDPTLVIESEYGKVYYRGPKGTSMKYVDENGEVVPSMKFHSPNGVKLIPLGEMDWTPPFAKKTDLNELPFLYAEAARVSAELNVINDEIRPYELGVIESKMNNQRVMLGEFSFALHREDITEYDFPEEASQLVESGKWKLVEAPITKGRTMYVPPVKVGAEVTESEEATV